VLDPLDGYSYLGNILSLDGRSWSAIQDDHHKCTTNIVAIGFRGATRLLCGESLPSAFVISEINGRDNAHSYLPDHGLPEGVGNLPRFVVSSDDADNNEIHPQQLKEYLGMLIPNDWIHTRLQFTRNRDLEDRDLITSLRLCMYPLVLTPSQLGRAHLYTRPLVISSAQAGEPSPRG